MSDKQENNESGTAKGQPGIFTQFKKPTIALIVIMVFVSFAKLSTPVNPQINQQKKYAAENKENITQKPVDKPATNQSPNNYMPGSQGIDAVPEPIANTPPPVEDTHNNERLIALEEKMARMQEEHAAEINGLKAKLDSQNQAAQSRANSMLSALVVFGQMKDAINNGKPYAGELNQLGKISSIDSGIDGKEILSALKNHSLNGMITPQLLKEKFAPLAKLALFNKDEGGYKNILHKFITFRKTGEQPGSDDEAVIARAEFKLMHDDLAHCINELANLTPQAQQVFADWLQDARDWLDTQEKLARLQLLLTQTEIAPQP